MPNPNLPISARYNTYVGARYVPLFANPTEWDNSILYEPLTIVTHQGNSFTSKTFVPTGIDITNEVYWAPTGNFNSQLESYRQEVLKYTKGRPFRTLSDFDIKQDCKDYTQDFQSALNVCAANGYMLWIGREETIKLSDIVILPANLTMRLDGTITSELRTTYLQNFNGIDEKPGYSGNGNIYIFGDGVITDNNNKLSPLNCSLRIAHADNVIIDGITFKINSLYHCIEVISSRNVRLTNLKFININQALVKNTSSCIQIETANSDSGQGGAIPYDNTINMDVLIEGCYFYDCRQCIESQAVSTTNFYPSKNIKIVNNWFENISESAVYPFTWEESEISYNTCVNAGYGFLYVIGGLGNKCKSVSIKGNLIKNCGKAYGTPGVATTMCPIFLNDYVDSVIADNVIIDSWGLALAMFNINNCVVANNQIVNPCLINIQNRADTVAIMNGTNSKNIIFDGNVIKCRSDDEYTSGLFSGGSIPATSKYVNNFIKMPIMYQGNSGAIVDKEFTTIASGNFKQGNVITLSNPISQYAYMIVYISFNNNNFSHIIPVQGRLAFGSTYVGTNGAESYFGKLNMSADRMSITVSNLAASANENSLSITAIEAVFGTNAAVFNSYQPS